MTFHNAGGVYSAASGAVKDDPKLSVSARKQRAEEYATRAMELLHKANAAGVYDKAAALAFLRNDPDLRFIRDRPQFQILVKEIEKRLKKEEE